MYSKNPHKLLRIMFKKNYVSLLFFLFVFSSGLAQKGFYANSATGNDPNLGLVGFPKKLLRLFLLLHLPVSGC